MSTPATTTSQQHKFRSVLPHEPLPQEDVGYLLIQGSFQPKQSTKELESNENDDLWTCALLRETMLQSTLVAEYSIRSVEVLDKHSPFTKIRLELDNPWAAQQIMYEWRLNKVSPADVLCWHGNKAGDCTNKNYTFSHRPLQVTQLTKCPLDPFEESAWSRSNPPKFRRLLDTASSPQDGSLQEERSRTRLIYCDGLLEKTKLSKATVKYYQMVHAIRTLFEIFDTSGRGVEVFCSKKHFLLSCHIGMRSNQDATRAIQSLQGQVVQWNIVTNNTHEGRNNRDVFTMASGKLFLDYAQALVPRHHQRNQEAGSGEPSRSECTSTTDKVNVPGLVLMENYISSEQQDVLMAALTGPHAPWAPSQTTPSQSGMVKRRVQHYGYVFDYQTANVLRDRRDDAANCPPMPSLESENHNVYSDKDLEDIVDHSTKEGDGWNLLAGIIEQTRRYNFSTRLHSSEATPTCFPDLNQMTVNEYKPREGIGSHIDTESAFGDGLLSLSLNGGVVMEFRRRKQAHANDDDKRQQEKKLVYLPPRSLLLMSGPARYEWEHMIVSRRTDTHQGVVLPRSLRVSLTLRTALELPTTEVERAKPLARVDSNHFPPRWGTGSLDNTQESNNTVLTTPETERRHVHHVYDSIATQWHHTRGKRGVLWPGATQFLKGLPPGSVVADVGCGDGKYFSAILEAGSYVIGTDISRPLLLQAASRRVNHGGDPMESVIPESRLVSEGRRHLFHQPAVAVGDCMNVPLRSNSCDAAVCIAVMHHLSTGERRIRCIQELVRIVKTGGTINIQAWAMEQEDSSRRKFASTDVFVPFNAQPRYLDKVNSKQPSSQASSLSDSSSSEHFNSGTAPVTNGGCKSVAQMYSEAYKGVEYDENKGLVVFQRYCHLYRKGELEELATQVNGANVIETGYESGNYFVILKVQ